MTQTEIITAAAQLARTLHATQTRKSSGEPVFDAHLVPVSQLVQQYGGSSEAIAAALLHDSIEDCGDYTRALILGSLGREVLALVEECTEPGTGGKEKAPWRERKEGYLQHIQAMSIGGLLISLADKTQQAEELSGTVSAKGDDAYSIFNAGKSSTLWFFNQLSSGYHDRIDSLSLSNSDASVLLNRFDRAVALLV